MDRVGLTELAEGKKYKKYSLGMKQRLGIAAAVVEKPEILILDEPMNSLDEDGIECTKRIVLEEKERGALVIVSCHDSAWLRDVCDEVYILKEGELFKPSKSKTGLLLA